MSTVVVVLLLWPVVALALGVWLGRCFAQESRRIDDLIAEFNRDSPADDLRADEWWVQK